MIFTVVFVIGHYLWQKRELSRLNVQWAAIPKEFGFKVARVKGFNIADRHLPALVRLEDLQIRSSDIIVCSFPKSGTTWMQEIVYLLANDLDFTKSISAVLDVRSPMLESPCLPVGECPSPRVIKTHLPFSLLPRGAREGKCRIIYVMRNPKDVTVSLYHFMKMNRLYDYRGDISDCARLMLDGTTIFGPYWTHLQQFWEQRGNPAVLITTYEEMKQNLPETIRAVAEFIDKRMTAEQIAQVADWCSFSAMKHNSMTNKKWDRDLKGDFFRNGAIGDWKTQLAPDVAEALDAAYEKHLKPLGIVFNSGSDLAH